MRLPSLLLALLCTSLALTGCGLQSNKDRYIADLRPLNDRLVDVNGDMVKAINTASATDPRGLADELTPLSGRMTRLSRQIGDLDTPEDLRQESAALMRSLDQTGVGANRTARFARRADRRALAGATVNLADDVNRVIRNTRRLAEATGAAG